MKALASYNLKGGVGKTATAVTLAWHAARDGQRTLLWDLDPQGAATYLLRIDPHLSGGARALSRGTTDVAAEIRGTDTPNLDLLPADFRLRKLDSLLDESGGRRRLAEAIAPVVEDYDFVLVDCPPSIGRTIEAVLRLRPHLLVPVIPTPLSVRTLDQLAEFVREHRIEPMQVMPFFTMADRRKSIHLETMRELPERYPQLLETIVPAASEVERMSVERRPLGVFAPGCAADLAYSALWREISDRIGL